MTTPNKKRLISFVVAALVICYLTGPFVAGALRIGDRLGPAIYPESFHRATYTIGHESLYNEKPREPFDTWMYRRPLFYELPRRLKSPKEREAYIEMARRNESPRLQELIKMNQQVK